jgi:predicted transcriptional regulator
MDDVTLGERELDVMAILWEIGSGTVGEVRERLPDELAYTTVLTILRNLEAKGFVSHLQEGKAHRYFPRLEQRAARQTALARIIDKLFQGSPEQLLAQLVDDHELTPDDLRRLARRASEPPPRKRGAR